LVVSRFRLHGDSIFLSPDFPKLRYCAHLVNPLKDARKQLFLRR
jgi:hypothetical protein